MEQVLIGVAKLLKANLRQPNILARIGGKEFSILLPETSAISAVAFAVLITEELSKLLITGDWQEEINISRRDT
jgi:diguanylate cyclase (GGDEF)-like protein